MNLYQYAGPMALGTRLRRLGDLLLQDARRIYELYGVEIDPRWFPVFYMLTIRERAGITELAESIGQTHPAVSQVVKAMIKAGLVLSAKSEQDARVNAVALTETGRAAAEALQLQCADVNRAVVDLFSTLDSPFWSDLGEIEQALGDRCLFDRVQEVRRHREQSAVTIVDYEPRYRRAFAELSIAWIQQHFELEDADKRAIDDPEGYIIQRGGYIAVALRDSSPVGVCALLRMDERRMELAKMAVADKAQGLGIGRLLGDHVIARARRMGAQSVYLESNSSLKPALALYRKLGFQRVDGNDSPYARCDVQMELRL